MVHHVDTCGPTNRVRCKNQAKNRRRFNSLPLEQQVQTRRPSNGSHERNEDPWPLDKITRWEGPFQKYLSNQPSGLADADGLLSLI
ncbi:hypothetical protein BDV10DRAFT_175226 [Aspergillus recurvatus]